MIASTTSPSRQSAISSAITAAGSRTTFDDERRHALREDVGDGVDVARQPGDDPARLLLREVAEREPGQVVEEVAAQAEHDPLADPGEAADQERLRTQPATGDREVDERRRSSGSSRRRRTMPLSIAARTSSQPPVCAAALPAADEQQHGAHTRRALGVAGQSRLTPRRPRRRTAPRTRRPRASSSRGVPDSTIRPSTSTTARSASSTVESRCVATSTVRPASAGRRRVTSRRSVSVSTADSGSSRTTHARVRDERARERDALALAAGEVDAALADQRVVAVGQLVREGVDAGRLAGGEHVLPVRVLAAGRAGCRAAAPRTGSAAASRARRRAQLGERQRRAHRRRRRARGRRSGRRSAAAG